VADAASIRESPRGLRTDAGLQRISPLQGFHGVICPPPRPPLRCDLGYRISPRWGFRLAHCEPVWRNKADGVQWMFSALFQQPRTGMRGRLSAGSQRRLELSGDSRRATKPHAHSGHCHQTTPAPFRSASRRQSGCGSLWLMCPSAWHGMRQFSRLASRGADGHPAQGISRQTFVARLPLPARMRWFGLRFALTRSFFRREARRS
jgi:hypothetical protein